MQADVTVIDLTADFDGGGDRPRSARPVTGGNGGDAGDATAVPALAAVVPDARRTRRPDLRRQRQRAVRPEDRIRRRLGRPLQRASNPT